MTEKKHSFSSIYCLKARSSLNICFFTQHKQNLFPLSWMDRILTLCKGHTCKWKCISMYQSTCLQKVCRDCKHNSVSACWLNDGFLPFRFTYTMQNVRCRLLLWFTNDQKTNNLTYFEKRIHITAYVSQWLYIYIYQVKQWQKSTYEWHDSPLAETLLQEHLSFSMAHANVNGYPLTSVK